MLRIVALLTARAPAERPRRSPGDQRHVGGLDRHVGTGADGDADVGLSERRRVVDPVADHRHQLALVLQVADLERLVLGQNLGEHALDPDLAGDRLSGPACCRR